MKREIKISLSLIILLFANLAQAESRILESAEFIASAGYATVSKDSFSSGTGMALAIEKKMHYVDVLLEGMNAKFDSKTLPETYIEVLSLNTAFGKSFLISEKESILGMSGISFWKAQATLVSSPVGSDSDISPWAGAGIKSDRFGSIHLYSTVKYFDDISGGDIQLISLQVGMDL